MTPVERFNWKIKVKGKSKWKIIFSSDEEKYWGTARFSGQGIITELIDKKERLYEISLNLPALSATVLQ